MQQHRPLSISIRPSYKWEKPTASQKQGQISVAWINYAKAFDSAPYSYIKWLLNAMHNRIPLYRFLQSLMEIWTVRYEVRSLGGLTERNSSLRIRSGVLQDSSFHPRLFCLAMTPISHAINNTGCYYVTASGKLKCTLYRSGYEMNRSKAPMFLKLTKAYAWGEGGSQVLAHSTKVMGVRSHFSAESELS